MTEADIKFSVDPSYVSVDQIAARLKNALVDYLEASSHIRHLDVVRERRKLLEREGEIAQRPFIETTPSYKVGSAFDQLGLPDQVGETLSSMTTWTGAAKAFPRPYLHQAEALQAFFNRHLDLVITTGTGSGKTECFLWPMLGTILQEASQRPTSFSKPGVRVIILYPTNALVGDQISRLRRLFGSSEIRDLFARLGTRVPTFGTYTSRTPYPGERHVRRDKDRLKPIVDNYFETMGKHPELQKALELAGRWPIKDIQQFAVSGYETSSTDSELLTRHEMQTTAPDILVTNYSMLEYMLMRPIERTIFDQTRKWLEDSDDGQLIFVLDEAHLYRGSSGTEVSLLIRRLLARLGIVDQLDRVRFILSSASLGEESTARSFARDLTGKSDSAFEVVVSKSAERPTSAPASEIEGTALAHIPAEVLASLHLPGTSACARAMSQLAVAMNWQEWDGVSVPLNTWLYGVLYDFPPINLIMTETSTTALDIETLSEKVFPKNPQNNLTALSCLLTLGTYARRDDRPLLPTRVHMMFRGINGLYACINPRCDARSSREDDNPVLGALYTEPRVHCTCGGRVFEMYSHSDCGAVFLRCFHEHGEAIEFLWHEQGADQELAEAFLLVGDPHANANHQELKTLDIQVTTGRIDRSDSHVDLTARYRAVVRSPRSRGSRRFGVYFGTCPRCLKRNQSFRIQSMRTTGEEPFGILVRQQFSAQSNVNLPSRDDPNGGKKALLFSDGRQRAARLARDLPRAVEFEAFRGALTLAWNLLQENSREPTLETGKLYSAFVCVCATNNLSFFDSESGDDARLNDHVNEFIEFHERSVEDALEDSNSIVVPDSFRMALAKQLSDPKASLSRSGVATPVLRRREWDALKKEFTADESDLLTYSLGWLRRYLDEGLVDSELTDDQRRMAIPNWEPTDKDFTGSWNPFNLSHSSVDRCLKKLLLSNDVVNLSKLSLNFLLTDQWALCGDCGHLQEGTQSRICLNCASPKVNVVEPDSDQLNARISHWRSPALKANTHGHVMTAGVEEHSAQLSFRDKARNYATTEEHELRFLGLQIGESSRPIDILSCTTTMEVGIDIGSLTAVGLRNIPPRRDNYQQRAGRAGRRGTSVSTVVSFGQNGPHDSYYFQHPEEMIRGKLVPPRIQTGNVRLAVRHFHAWIIQTFFHEQLAVASHRPKDLFSTLGLASEFFSNSGDFSLQALVLWIETELPNRADHLEWLPTEVTTDFQSYAMRFTKDLQSLATKFEGGVAIEDGLLDVLFDHGFLPSYAFPTDVVALTLFNNQGNIEEQPQASKSQALSEYAPGRNVVVNKKTYRIGGVYDPYREAKGIEDLLKSPDYYHYCTNCTYVESSASGDVSSCPVCNNEIRPMPMIEPPGFAPVRAEPLKPNDTRQEYSSARRAQLPTPGDDMSKNAWIDGPGRKVKRFYHLDQELLVANVGLDGKGFSICPQCGAAKPTSEAVQDGHYTPYPVKLNRWGKGRSQRCAGVFQDEISLGTSFRSDVLLMRVNLKRPIIRRINPSLVDTFWSATEAISLAASRVLDIDSNELSGGFRFLKGPDDVLSADIYLYDTASGGAGYAYGLGSEAKILLHSLEDARVVLRDCPRECDRSCKECLKNYRNQFDDSHLDRHLGFALLDYVMDDRLPEIESLREKQLLTPLHNYFEMEQGKIPDNLRVYSALRDVPPTINDEVWLDDYTLLRDLPKAANMVRNR